MTPTKTRPHKPMLAECTSEILSLCLSVDVAQTDYVDGSDRSKEYTFAAIFQYFE